MLYQGREANPIEIARDIVLKNPVIFDTETTGVGSDDEIVEISVVDINGKVLIDTLIKPVKTIPEEAVKIHGISNMDVKDADTFNTIWEQKGLKDILLKHPLCLYNSDFDIRMIKQTLNKYDIFFEHNPVVICVMKLFAEFNGTVDPNRGTFKWHKLMSAAEKCNIEIPKNLHRALVDTELTRKILIHIAEHLIM